ncbi:UDP-N-acetylmuramoylalanine--D-glutamate ligase [Fructobacillus pseudoficulneus]|uniref:UDP-N-acetylmuramoylalanine--D-glutamate ligase n=1 Tax=Fructobacillus pseudoficulneus TaxID=220714 RepID=A0A3F3H2D9_9LACO|nr:UDP-N-acetylmuramoyl-L-alanine--D-glutamate ligase [Fructobacillus pseudoficulneus]GAP02738.1 UDP-N-acetylmuramoylalanine--D-glutamate ligase [Fructobacillus pseudoficulneus]SEH39520.1 UDP-N-acetylmuramoylalanine--D-glutamate ligase [Fructobacillus pseudoficulneus]
MAKLNFNNKKVLVLGWAKSGKAATKRLLELGAQVTVANRDAIPVDDEIKALQEAGVVFAANDQADALAEDTDYVVKNPGIHYEQPLLEKAVKLEIPILTEVAVALSTFTGRLIVVTGSNGKTTTTTLLGKMLQADATQGKVVVAGNIGTPVCQVVGDLTAADTLVLELSSFQLLGIPALAPDIAVITNVFANHLDFHHTRAAYLAAKIHVTEDQTADQVLILNGEGPDTPVIASKTAAKVLEFDASNQAAYAHQSGDDLVFDGQVLMPFADVKLVGRPNLENVLAATTAATVAGANPVGIRHVLQSFGGVKHRLEFLFQQDDVIYYNDSKATDIEATQAALSAFDQPVIWLAGGLDRGDDLMRLAPDLKNVRQVIAFGETKDKVVALAKSLNLPVTVVESVEEAAPLAVKLAQPGEVVLFSPAAASWDQYPNFEIRGEAYEKALRAAMNLA